MFNEIDILMLWMCIFKKFLQLIEDIEILTDWLFDWMLYDTTVPETVLDKILLTFVNNANMII